MRLLQITINTTPRNTETIVIAPTICEARAAAQWLLKRRLSGQPNADRYIAICKPLKMRTSGYCGTARTWSIIGVLTVVSVLFRVRGRRNQP